jgi:hypothetical protein
LDYLKIPVLLWLQGKYAIINDSLLTPELKIGKIFVAGHPKHENMK